MSETFIDTSKISLTIIDDIKKRNEEVINSQDRLTHLKKNLDALIDAIDKKPSWFTQATILWAKLSSAQKIAVAISIVLLTTPLFIAGILTHLSILLLAPIYIVAVFFVGAVLLENHNNSLTNTKAQLKQEISTLAELLDSILKELEILNQKLADNINNLSAEISVLSTKIDALSKEISVLADEVSNLNTINDNLNSLTQKQEHLLSELTLTKNDLNTQNNKLEQKIVTLDEQIAKLEKINGSFETQLNQHQVVVDALRVALTNIVESTGADEIKKQVFVEKLETFITDKEASFDSIFERICKAEEQLAATTTELETLENRFRKNNEHYETLLKQHDKINRNEPSNSSPTPAHLLTSLGLHSNNKKKENNSTHEETICFQPH